MAPIPKKAATIILLREKKPKGFEVFLLKRHEKSSFMGGNFVYPGGRVDPNDGSPQMSICCKGMTPEEAQQILGTSISPEESLAHWIAGIRELFEEAGVLLAYDPKENLFRFEDPMQQERFSRYRDLIQKGNLNLLQLAQEEKISFALDQLYYYAHWITPEARSERFDTRFFLACHPSGQEASYDQRETTAEAWLTPRIALEQNLMGEVILSPPTLKTLEDLSRFDTVEEVISSLKKNEIRPILPILTKVSDETFLVFPWDPEYEIFKRKEVPAKLDHGRPSQRGDNTTRLILKKKEHWLPYCRTT